MVNIKWHEISPKHRKQKNLFCELNKGFSSKFPKGYQVQRPTPEECPSVHWLKCCEHKIQPRTAKHWGSDSQPQCHESMKIVIF